jgi:Circularly permutated YpsA SLOG family
MLRKIVSGGQTGADRAGLDFAIEVGLEHGGFVPRGRRAEDGRISEQYHLIELSSISYAVRTKRNVREGDGTVVFSLDPILTGGNALTFEYAGQVKKPRIHIHKSATDYSEEGFLKELRRLKDFIESNQIAVLNVAGPRESNQPGVYAFALRMLEQYWENR